MAYKRCIFFAASLCRGAVVNARKIFGTDGVRGVANRHPMTSELALQLGRAAGYLFRQDKRHHTIVIGKDTRLSGYMLETALASGICSMGVDVLLVGPFPTPGIAFLTRGMRADAGVVISASHNPYQDNGIKFFDRDGFKLPDTVEAEMERLITSGAIDDVRPSGEEIGKAARIDDAPGRYIEYLKRTIPPGQQFDGMKIVIDCAHGAGYRVAPDVFTELGAHVIPVGMSPDGKNINRNCGSLHPQLMAQLVREHGADCGFALDGDADRVIMCDERGEIVDGDVLLAICAADMARAGTLAKKSVVATVMSNAGFDCCMKDRGITVVRTPVGDRYVVQTMREQGYNLGGEQSGHLVFLDQNTTGDGILGALQVLTIVQSSGKPLSVAKRIFTPLPQVLLNIRVREKRPLGEVAPVATAIRACEGTLGGRGRVLVRYSGTEMLARVMVEGEDPAAIRAMADAIAQEIQTHLGPA
ncbi:MAG: phosphoglucosamine mutase [Deltaproteobacteria bacterium]|nr:phosphoglucosamine mutase [Deltaproteobacteria bacterium]